MEPPKIPSPRRRLPDWLKTSLPGGPEYTRLKSLIQQRGLNTVCESASCPNIGQCWGAGTLTVMILGDHCSRACRFCGVATGRLTPPRPDEPAEVAALLSQLDLRYVVITSVDRDDLPDGGAGHWAQTLRAVRSRCPGLKIEALIPDFRGGREALSRVCRMRPDVLSHNLETVRTLQGRVRPQCRYEWSLDTLRAAARDFGLVTKSGLMLGHGETRREVIHAMHDLLETGCRILTLGQYLRPSRDHLPVVEYIRPQVFAELKAVGESLGFDHVAAGPLVRSSYLADQQAQAAGI